VLGCCTVAFLALFCIARLLLRNQITASEVGGASFLPGWVAGLVFAFQHSHSINVFSFHLISSWTFAMGFLFSKKHAVTVPRCIGGKLPALSMLCTLLFNISQFPCTYFSLSLSKHTSCQGRKLIEMHASSFTEPMLSLAYLGLSRSTVCHPDDRPHVKLQLVLSVCARALIIPSFGHSLSWSLKVCNQLVRTKHV
jgi:hypothetical protein